MEKVFIGLISMLIFVYWFTALLHVFGVIQLTKKKDALPSMKWLIPFYLWRKKV
jgi:hypothetical protein